MKRAIIYRLLLLCCCQFVLLVTNELFALEVEISATVAGTLDCNCQGELAASVTDSNSTYEFLWNTGETQDTISNLCAGLYSVTVIDIISPDTGYASLFLADSCLNIQIAFNDSVTSWHCNGAAAAQTGGGTSPYAYLWSNGESSQVISDLCPGNYCVTVSDSDNHSSISCINIPEFIDTSCVADFSWLPAGTASCYETCFEFIDNSVGDDYSLSWSFGDSVFATSLNPDFSFTEYGDHLVCLTIITSSCVDSTCEIIPVDSCSISLDTVITAISSYGACDGALGIPVQNASQPYIYTWNTGDSTGFISGLCEGQYCVTVTDAFACKDSICIELQNPPDTTCIASFSVSRTGLTQFEFDGSSSNGNVLSWNWDFGDQSSSSSNLPTHIYTGLGSYDVCLVIETETGCIDTSCQLINIDSCDIILSANIQSTSCFGSCDGFVSLLPDSGTAPYYYHWINSASQATDTNLFDNLCAGSYNVTVTDADHCTLVSSVSVSEPSSITNDIIIGEISCYGACDGIAEITSSGGTFPYTYMLNNDSIVSNPITELCEGNYSLVVRDNNFCNDTVFFEIAEQPDMLIITGTDYENVSCFLGSDGSAQVFVTGGSNPISYLWSNAETSSYIDSLDQGDYIVTVTDFHDCSIIEHVVISQPGPIFINLFPVNANCNGLCDGSITGENSGGTFPYSFDWNNGMTGNSIIGLCAGQYQITVTDANLCTGTASTVIESPDTLISEITDTTHILCNEVCSGGASINASGGLPPYIYLWSNDSTSATIDQLCAGHYSVTVTDTNSCVSISEVVLYQPDALELSIIGEDETNYGNCNGSAEATATGGTLPYSYSWSQSSIDPIATDLCSGIYYLAVTDQNGCSVYDSVNILSPPVFSINGRVYVGTNLLPEGVALLYNEEPDGTYKAISYSLVENGEYEFNYLDNGTYLIYAIPYFDVGLQTPNYLPTYYGNKVFWESATQIVIDTSLNGMDIFLKFYDNVLYGPGSLSGTVSYSDPAYWEEDIYGVDWFDAFSGNKGLKSYLDAGNIPVLILNSNGMPLNFALSDSTGSFELTQIPLQSYFVHPEKAGYTTTQEEVTLNQDTVNIDSLAFHIVYKEIIILTDGISEHKTARLIAAYPNPFDEMINIEIEILEPCNINLDLKNSLGQVVSMLRTKHASGKQILQLDTSSLSGGVYFATLSLDNGDMSVIKIIK